MFAWRRKKARGIEDEIHEAILLACTDMVGADETLTALLERSRAESADAKVVLACLKALSVIKSVTGREDGQWVEICRELVRSDNSNPSNFISLGNAEEACGNVRSAIVAYESALALCEDPRTKQLVRHFLDRLREPVPAE